MGFASRLITSGPNYHYSTSGEVVINANYVVETTNPQFNHIISEELKSPNGDDVILPSTGRSFTLYKGRFWVKFQIEFHNRTGNVEGLQLQAVVTDGTNSVIHRDFAQNIGGNIDQGTLSLEFPAVGTFDGVNGLPVIINVDILGQSAFGESGTLVMVPGTSFAYIEKIGDAPDTDPANLANTSLITGGIQ